jgi:hypothetical protein
LWNDGGRKPEKVLIFVLMEWSDNGFLILFSEP